MSESIHNTTPSLSNKFNRIAQIGILSTTLALSNARFLHANETPIPDTSPPNTEFASPMNVPKGSENYPPKEEPANYDLPITLGGIAFLSGVSWLAMRGRRRANSKSNIDTPTSVTNSDGSTLSIYSNIEAGQNQTSSDIGEIPKESVGQLFNENLKVTITLLKDFDVNKIEYETVFNLYNNFEIITEETLRINEENIETFRANLELLIRLLDSMLAQESFLIGQIINQVRNDNKFSQNELDIISSNSRILRSNIEKLIDILSNTGLEMNGINQAIPLYHAKEKYTSQIRELLQNVPNLDEHIALVPVDESETLPRIPKETKHQLDKTFTKIIGDKTIGIDEQGIMKNENVFRGKQLEILTWYLGSIDQDEEKLKEWCISKYTIAHPKFKNCMFEELPLKGQREVTLKIIEIEKKAHEIFEKYSKEIDNVKLKLLQIEIEYDLQLRRKPEVIDPIAEKDSIAIMFNDLLQKGYPTKIIESLYAEHKGLTGQQRTKLPKPVVDAMSLLPDKFEDKATAILQTLIKKLPTDNNESGIVQIQSPSIYITEIKSKIIQYIDRIEVSHGDDQSKERFKNDLLIPTSDIINKLSTFMKKDFGDYQKVIDLDDEILNSTGQKQILCIQKYLELNSIADESNNYFEALAELKVIINTLKDVEPHGLELTTSTGTENMKKVLYQYLTDLSTCLISMKHID